MKRIFIILLFALTVPIAALADEIGKSTDDKIKQLALEAILENPEIIEQAISKLQLARAEQEKQNIRTFLTERRNDIEDDPNAPVLGNPNGDVTVVEFFDYNCPYCKRAVGPIKELLKNDKNIRLVFREWPILSEGSLHAAQIALAARKQGKYEAVHFALMAGKRATLESALAIATKLDLDIELLKKDMESSEVLDHIRMSKELADGLGISGTPTFVIGDQMAPGYVPIDRLMSMTLAARNSKIE